MLELLLALFIIAFVLLPLIAMELQIERQGDRADVQAQAHLAGRQKLEELLAVPYDELAGGNDVIPLRGTRTLTREWSVRFDAPRAEMATVEVVIRETAGDGLGPVPAMRLTAAIRDYTK